MEFTKIARSHPNFILFDWILLLSVTQIAFSSHFQWKNPFTIKSNKKNTNWGYVTSNYKTISSYSQISLHWFDCNFNIPCFPGNSPDTVPPCNRCVVRWRWSTSCPAVGLRTECPRSPWCSSGCSMCGSRRNTEDSIRAERIYWEFTKVRWCSDIFFFVTGMEICGGLLVEWGWSFRGSFRPRWSDGRPQNTGRLWPKGEFKKKRWS